MDVNKREFVITGNSFIILWINKLFPGLADKYLARTGYQGEQTDQPVENNRRDNLWHPVPDAYAARGEFNSQSTEYSYFFWLRTHPLLISISIFIIILLIVILSITF